MELPEPWKGLEWGSFKGSLDREEIQEGGDGIKGKAGAKRQ